MSFPSAVSSSRTLPDSLHILASLHYETWSSRITRTSLPLRADAGASRIVRPSILYKHAGFNF